MRAKNHCCSQTKKLVETDLKKLKAESLKSESRNQKSKVGSQ